MLLSKFKILGHSMEPTLKNGQSILISKFPYIFHKPQINDIVAFEENRKILIKRINQIENEKVFVLGDNLNDSLDSRKIGYIHLDNILGKVICKI